MNLKKMLFAFLALGALNANAQDDVDRHFDSIPASSEHHRGINKITFGPMWTESMATDEVIRKNGTPFEARTNIALSLNGYSKRTDHHLMFDGAKNSIQTLNGYRISEKNSVDLFFFYEKSLAKEEQYLSIGFQKTFSYKDIEDLIVIFGEVGTDFHEHPAMINIGIVLIPQIDIWTR